VTTIAYRDGVIAADSLITQNGTRIGTVAKIVRVPGGGLAGVAGELGGMARFLDWARSGAEGELTFSTCEIDGFLVTAEGQVLVTTDSGGMVKIKQPFHAVGSGRDFARGALAAGATAVEAVKIAMKFDTQTGGRVRSLVLSTQEFEKLTSST